MKSAYDVRLKSFTVASINGPRMVGWSLWTRRGRVIFIVRDATGGPGVHLKRLGDNRHTRGLFCRLAGSVHNPVTQIEPVTVHQWPFQTVGSPNVPQSTCLSTSLLVRVWRRVK
jgi:hypothetical protein